MFTLTANTPLIRREEVRHGQGVITYTQSNEQHRYYVGQDAPDPIRQSHTPARAPRRYIAIMETRPSDWESGFRNNFLTDFVGNPLLPRLQPSRVQQDARAQQNLDVRPNISKASPLPYGAFFEVND